MQFFDQIVEKTPVSASGVGPRTPAHLVQPQAQVAKSSRESQPARPLLAATGLSQKV
jgi:hypothetical protein